MPGSLPYEGRFGRPVGNSEGRRGLSSAGAIKSTDPSAGHGADSSGARLFVGSAVQAQNCGFDETDAIFFGANPTPIAGHGVAGQGSDPAYVIYTSGSTGRPKGCVLTHDNVLSLVKATLPLVRTDHQDRWTLFHSVSFDFSVWEMWGAWATGAALVIVPDTIARSAEDFLAFVDRHGVTVLNQVPSVFRALQGAHAAAGHPPLPVHYLIFGGESVDLPVVRDFLESLPAARRPVVINMYGITETTIFATWKEITGEVLAGPVRSPIGRALAHLRVDVRDDDGLPVPAGETGELWLSGEGVAREYLNRPDLTAERFPLVDGHRCYRSGDLARELPSGELEYLGRADQQVKLRGFRVELGEIEVVLRDCADVDDAGVAVVTNQLGVQLLVACVVGGGLDFPGQIRKHAQSRLPRYMVPGRYVAVPRLPLTSSGKLDRQELTRLAAGDLHLSGRTDR